MRRLKIFLASMIAALAATACLSGPAAAAVTGADPCENTVAPVQYSHVLVWELENHSFTVSRGHMPYLDKVANRCAYYADGHFKALFHPSLPNYIAQTSGSNWGITDDSNPSAHPLNHPSIFTQLGDQAHSYMQSMPSNCVLSNSGLYAVRHNPATYYTYLNSRTLCQANDQPYSALQIALNNSDVSFPSFAWVTPDVCHDAHGNKNKCPAAKDPAVADAYLQTELPKIINSPVYQSGTMIIFVTWDEGGGGGDGQNIYTVAIAPNLGIVGTGGGVVVSGPVFNHYSLLKYTENQLGVGTLTPEPSSAYTSAPDLVVPS